MRHPVAYSGAAESLRGGSCEPARELSSIGRGRDRLAAYATGLGAAFTICDATGSAGYGG